MKNSSKRFNILNNLINKPFYSLDEGINLLKSLNTTKFIESTEAHISLNLKNIRQQIRGNLVLPNNIGKVLKIAIYTDNPNVDELYDLGVSKIGFDDLLNEIRSGNINFDVLLTSHNLISKLSAVGKILGLKGLMPSLKNGTITNDFKKTIHEFQSGKFEYKSDKNNVIHFIFGKSNLSDIALKENLISVYNDVKKNKPSGLKGKYIKSFHICTTMSPSIKLFIS